ncbi:hypothetical protein [Ideonella sp. B508-1]|uniref:hypothetical protein n=1 Tax=Ideonella sp. B508-1 TaxID=137716 RepID=UPI0003B6578D|nr:hypothetical protein [Ideonella sp. B508-1]
MAILKEGEAGVPVSEICRKPFDRLADADINLIAVGCLHFMETPGADAHLAAVSSETMPD